jgi:hypothetical protein
MKKQGAKLARGKQSKGPVGNDYSQDFDLALFLKKKWKREGGKI